MKTLDKINLKNKLYIKYFKKADDVTVMNPKLDTYFSHSFHLIFFWLPLFNTFFEGNSTC